MGATKVDAKQAQFILGMRSPVPDAAAFERQLHHYLKAEARIDALVQDRIFRKPFALPPKTMRLITTLESRPHTTVEKSDAKELLEQVTDLLDDLNGLSERIEELSTALKGAQGAVAKDSPAHQAAAQCLAEIGKAAPQLQKAVRSVGVAKPHGGAVDAKALCAYGSAAIVAAMLAGELTKRLPRWLERFRKR